MIRRVLLALLAIVLFVFVRRAFRAAGAARAGQREGRRTSQLVRDRVCNTYIQESAAIRLESGGRVSWFCSQECRARHLAGTAGPAALVS
jgi:YHS domain-containing protein